MRRLLVLTFLIVAGPALACAVPTGIEVSNTTRRLVREIIINSALPPGSDTTRFNHLPAAGLAPGARTTITMPSCIGTYVLTVVFADGTQQVHVGIDASRIRAIELR